MSGRAVDPDFLDLPCAALTDAALERARQAGAQHAELRVHRVQGQDLSLRDGQVEQAADRGSLGLAVRVVHDGTWGFAAAVELTTDTAVRLVDTAVAMAKVSRPVNTDPVELADEPGYGEVSWVSDYAEDPFHVPVREKTELLGGWGRRLLAAGVDHVDSSLRQVKETTFLATLGGTRATQQRVYLELETQVTAVDREAGGFETLRTTSPPVGRGYEWVRSEAGWDHQAELDALPGQLAQKVAARSVEPGRYDLVVDPTNLWLTIHESIGHATELDRALGYEASYAGTSFATPDQLGTLAYGSPVMHVTADRQAANGLASVGWDDEGVAAQTWDLVRDGVLVGYQLDRRIARAQGLGRSNGCAYADSAGHVPVQRMANVSLQPDPDGPSTAELIAGVERGIYVVGDNSWSIDMQRYNFQFTGQRFYEIRDGRLVGMLRDVAYQATTTEFWGSMARLGGPQTYLLAGALNCGKAQPGQVAPVSHGCPSALFTGVSILNTRQEGGQ